MIELIPAIDIIDGRCVRLSKGDYDACTVYNDNPVEVAREFAEFGFTRLHVVDLDGAKSKHIVNHGILQGITSSTPLTVDFGGGIKTEDDLRLAFDSGAAMVTVGSLAVTEPDTFLDWVERYGADKFILGADVRDGFISINGWKEGSNETLIDFIGKYIYKGVSRVLCTDISRDGMLSGTAVGLYKEVMKAYPDCHLIASGGVGCLDDIKALRDAGIPAVVFGKAIYEGRISLPELVEWNKKENAV